MAIMDFTKLALKNLFSKPATTSYPAQPIDFPKRSRGHIEIDIDECIMCGICMRKCPSDAIKVDRTTKTWSIERLGCVQCGNCVIHCPKQCLSLLPGYTEPNVGSLIESFSQPIPETTGNIVNDIDECILCGICAKNCPQECLSVDRKENKTWSIDHDKCVKCGICIEKCPKKSLKMEQDNKEKGVITQTKK